MIKWIAAGSHNHGASNFLDRHNGVVESLLTGNRIRRDWHQLVLIPTVTCILLPLRWIAAGLIFPLHVTFPVGVAIRFRITAGSQIAFRTTFDALGNVGVLPVTARVAHRDRLRVNAFHRHDGNSHRGNNLSAINDRQIITLEVRTVFSQRLGIETGKFDPIAIFQAKLCSRFRV